MLCGVFYLLSFLCYARGALRTPGRTDWKFLALSIFLALCSLLSKEQGITSIGVCAAYDVLLHWKNLWRRKSGSSLTQGASNGQSLVEINNKATPSSSMWFQPEQKRVLQMGERVGKFKMLSRAPCTRPFNNVAACHLQNNFLVQNIPQLLFVVFSSSVQFFPSVVGNGECGYDVVSDVNESWLGANFQARGDEGSLPSKQDR